MKYGVNEHYRACVSFDEFKSAISDPEQLPVGHFVLAADSRQRAPA
jgi:hypothetical protein